MVADEMAGSQPTIDLEQVRYWLDQLHGDSQGFIHVCATDNWTGQVCETVDEAVGFVRMMDFAGKAGIYIRTTTLKTKLPPGSRGSASDSLCIPALWADVDIAGPGHKRTDKKLPESERDARSIVEQSGLPEPTLWVHSGGGLYPWWLLQKPYCIEDTDDLERTQFLSKIWHEILGSTAEKLGWFYGTEVHNLDRVMRIVGTINRKVPDLPTLCQLTDGGSGRLYSFDELFDKAQELKLALPVPEQPTLPVPVISGDEERPGDDFNHREPWDSPYLLHDWQVHHKVGDTVYWTRPGKKIRDGYSATTGRDPHQDRLWVFSSSTPFDPEKPYTKFAAYALLWHNGDYSAAATDLRQKGYGHRSQVITKPPEPEPLKVRPIDAPPPPGSPEREPLNVTNPAVVAEWLRDNCGRGKLAGMFSRNGELVFSPRVGEEGYIPTGSKADFDGPAQVRVLHPIRLVGRVQFSYDCYKINSKGDQSPHLVPLAAAQVVVAEPDMLTHVQRLNGVSHAPIVRPDGSIVTKPGYDGPTGMLYLPDQDMVVPSVSDQPDRDEVQKAVARILAIVQDFPFKREHDLANLFGLLLTPLLRQVIPPPYPMFAITAPMAGSGKTLLASLVRTIHGGVFRVEMPENDTELRKQLTSILDVTTGPVIHIDNVSGTLRTPVMAGLLTSARWEDRRLGTSQYVSLVNDRVWMITGNNVSIGGDIPRRTLNIVIDSDHPEPHKRTDFHIDDLTKFVEDHRGELLHALLTIIRSWVAAGMPKPGRVEADSYKEWRKAIRGILAHVEVPGVFADPSTQPESVGADETDWSDFLWTVHRIMGERSWTVKELLTHVGGIQSQLQPDMLPGDLPDKYYKANGRITALGRPLGMYLHHRNGRWMNGIKAVHVATQDHMKVWKVQVLPQ